MLTYITIFVVCVILAVVIRVVFRAVSESSHSLSTSKAQIDIVHSKPANKKAKATRNTATGTPRASTSTAKATEYIDAAWQGSGSQVREPQYAMSGAADSHCSLYDVSSAEPKDNHNPHVGWPYREEKLATGGKTYKVTRKVATNTPKLKTNTPRLKTITPRPNTIVKPWGW